MILSEEMTKLADGFRKRFKKTDQLSIDDMIRIISEPAWQYNDTELLVNDSQFVSADQHSVAIKPVPARNGNDIYLDITGTYRCGTDVNANVQIGLNNLSQQFTLKPADVDTPFEFKFNISGQNTSNLSNLSITFFETYWLTVKSVKCKLGGS